MCYSHMLSYTSLLLRLASNEQLHKSATGIHRTRCISSLFCEQEHSPPVLPLTPTQLPTQTRPSPRRPLHPLSRYMYKQPLTTATACHAKVHILTNGREASKGYDSHKPAVNGFGIRLTNLQSLSVVRSNYTITFAKRNNPRHPHLGHITFPSRHHNSCSTRLAHDDASVITLNWIPYLASPLPSLYASHSTWIGRHRKNELRWHSEATD
jgi:hypothetical protein